MMDYALKLAAYIENGLAVNGVRESRWSTLDGWDGHWQANALGFALIGVKGSPEKAVRALEWRHLLHRRENLLSRIAKILDVPVGLADDVRFHHFRENGVSAGEIVAMLRAGEVGVWPVPDTPLRYQVIRDWLKLTPIRTLFTALTKGG